MRILPRCDGRRRDATGGYIRTSQTTELAEQVTGWVEIP